VRVEDIEERLGDFWKLVVDLQADARGVETTVQLDEEQFVGAGVFLFASILERFLALYATVNSFNQLVARVAQREGVLKQWQPRAGEQALL
jgi:type VI secretion system protein ImpG